MDSDPTGNIMLSPTRPRRKSWLDSKEDRFRYPMSKHFSARDQTVVHLGQESYIFMTEYLSRRSSDETDLIERYWRSLRSMLKRDTSQLSRWRSFPFTWWLTAYVNVFERKFIKCKCFFQGSHCRITIEVKSHVSVRHTWVEIEMIGISNQERTRLTRRNPSGKRPRAALLRSVVQRTSRYLEAWTVRSDRKIDREVVVVCITEVSFRWILSM